MSMTMDVPREHQATPDLLWLDLTRKCQLACVHCYNASGPDGAHGTMTPRDWINVLDQAAACGVRHVQLIGGEPTLHPDAPELLDHALTLDLQVEVFSNLVHVTPRWWELFGHESVTLATSYYSDKAQQHNEMTARPSHARTRANIEKAARLGIALRVGIIGHNKQIIDAARHDLEALGVERIGVDHVRPFGRGAHQQFPDPASLCGRCGTGRAAVSPNGEVAPCVFAGWLGVGNVKDTPLATLLGSAAMAEANSAIRSAVRTERKCRPDKDRCYPDQTPCFPAQGPCKPEGSPPPPPCSPKTECNPGYETDKCFPDGY